MVAMGTALVMKDFLGTSVNAGPMKSAGTL